MLDCGPVDLECSGAEGNIPITRVVGPGVNEAGSPPDYDSDGGLAQPGLFEQNGIVGQRAWMSVSIYNGDIVPHTFRFTINDKLVGTATVGPAQGGIGQYATQCLDFPTEWLHFALRNPSPAPSFGLTPPTPGNNRYLIKADSPPNQEGEGGFTAQIYSITFEALAPVVFVHGILSGPEAWSEFSVPFTNNKYPWAAVELPEGKIEAVAIRDLEPQIKGIAKEFGVYRVHLVSHSKGGLWSRAVIQRLPPGDSVGVFSLFTLDTPHEGLVLADLADAFENLSAQPQLPFPSALGTLLTSYYYNSSIPDLTVSRVHLFNLLYRHVQQTRTYASGANLIAANGIRYFALGSDADIDHDGVIGPVEAMSPWYVADDFLYHFLGDVRRITIRQDSLGRSTIASIDPQPLFAANDIVVTAASSYLSEQPALFEAQPLRYRNHTTIHDSFTGDNVRGMITLGLERSLEQSTVQ
jgi:pimeloyl-ACP methyl ester carboxylesterase